MKRILVTGATGFLGRHLVGALSHRGDVCVRLVRDIKFSDAVSTTRSDPFMHADVLGSFDQVERAIAEYEINTVIHLAAQTQVSTAYAHPTGTFKDNIEGTWIVLEACRRQGVKHVVIAASDKSYGDGPVPYIEEQPLQPHGIYATSKACADMLASAYRLDYKMPIATTRCGNIYGPGHLNWSTLIPGTIRSVLRGRRPYLRSDGEPKRDYVYIDDVVDGYLRLIDLGMIGNYNFGTGVGTSAFDVAGTILGMMGSAATVEIGNSEVAKEIPEQVLDCTRAKGLGWKARSLAEGLEPTIAWYKEYLK